MIKTILDGYGYSLESKFIFDIETLEELRKVLIDIQDKNLKYKVLGSLKNVIFANQKSDIAILRLNGGVFKTIEREGDILNLGAGVEIADLMEFSIKESIGGIEHMVGIPSTIAGAVVGNSGAFGKEISENIVKIECLNSKGECSILERDSICFKYRGSNLDNFIITRVYLQLIPRLKVQIKKNMRIYMDRRLATQDLRKYSCGSFFKNNSKQKAASLIDSLGLKGYMRGGATVSSKHANFLINLNSCSSEDILSLKDILQRRVWREKRVWLIPEVELVW